MSTALQWYTEMKIGYKRTFTVDSCDKCGYPHGAEKAWIESLDPLVVRGCTNQSENHQQKNKILPLNT